MLGFTVYANVQKSWLPEYLYRNSRISNLYRTKQPSKRMEPHLKISLIVHSQSSTTHLSGVAALIPVWLIDPSTMHCIFQSDAHILLYRTTYSSFRATNHQSFVSREPYYLSPPELLSKAICNNSPLKLRPPFAPAAQDLPTKYSDIGAISWEDHAWKNMAKTASGYTLLSLIPVFDP